MRRSGVFGFLRAAASSLSSIGGSHVFTVVLDILDSIKAQKLSSKADTLLLDAVRAVRALSLHQPQGVAFKLRALRKIAIMLPTSSQIWSAAISDELHQAMIVIIQSDVDNLPHLGIQELALLHDTCLRVSYHSSQSRIQKTTQARWLELLQKVSSHVSTSSSEILEMWSQKTHR